MSIEDAIGERSTCSFVLRDKYDELAVVLQPGETVEVICDNVKIFGGTIERVSQTKIPGEGTTKFWQVDCVDWHQICDRRIVAETYENAAAGEIVADLIDKYLGQEGIIAGRLKPEWGYCYEPADKQAAPGSWGYNGGFAWDANAGLTGRSIAVRFAYPTILDKFVTTDSDTTSRIAAEHIRVFYSQTGLANSWVEITQVTKVYDTQTGVGRWTLTWSQPEPARYWKFSCDAPDNNYTWFIGPYTDDLNADNPGPFLPATIQRGPAVVEAVFNYVPASTCLDKLAELAGFSWWIDATKALHFVERATYSAPWVLDDPAKVNNLRVEKHRQGYRNRQYIKAGKDITDIQLETFKGNGSQKTFTVGFPLAKVPTVRVNGVEKTVGIKGIDTGKDWYWNKGDPVITQDEAATPLASTDTLEISYQGFFDVVVLTDDYAAIEERKSVEGGTGYYEAVEDEPYLSSREAAIQSANAKLRRYAKLTKQITFDTYLPGLRPGQILPVNLPDRGLVNEEFLIESVKFSEIGGGYWNYSVKAVSGEALGGWTRFFRNMATRGQAFVIRENIREDQVLIRLVQSQEGWQWAEQHTQTVFACPIPSASLYPSETLYPC